MKILMKLLIVFVLSTTLFAMWLRVIARRQSIPCPTWLAWLLENPYMESVASAKVILERADIRHGMKVLDVGCGPGRLTIPAARRVGPEGEVHALDIQPEMLRRTQERAHNAGLGNVRFIEAGAGEGGVEESAFDRALLVTVLGEIPDREAALTEIYNALRPGGILSITEVLPDPHYQPKGVLQQLTRQAGFTDAGITGNVIAYTANFLRD